MKTWKSSAKMMEFQLDKVQRNKKILPKLIANEAVNEFTQNFRRGGFKNKVTVPWRPRKNRDSGRGVLIGKGGGNKLWRSLRAKRVTQRRVVVGSSVHYAGVHNYGLMSGRKSAPFRMPKRKFIGRSTHLNNKIRKLILHRMK